MLEDVSWIFTIIALYGTYLNINQDKNCFYYWLISNSAFSAINFYSDMKAQGFLFGIYTIMSIIGIKTWKN